MSRGSYVSFKKLFSAAWKSLLYLHVSDDLVPIGNMNEAEAAFKSAGSNKIETESFDGYTAGVGTSMHEKAFLVAFFKGIYWLDYYGYGGRFIFPD